MVQEACNFKAWFAFSKTAEEFDLQSLEEGILSLIFFQICYLYSSQAWANWARSHEDPKVREAAAAVMSHSEEVEKSNYLMTPNETTVAFAKDILGSFGLDMEVR